MPSKKQLIVSVAVAAALMLAYNKIPAVRKALGGA